MSFFAKYDDEEHVQDPEKSHLDETSPLLGRHNEPESSRAPHNVPISHDDEEQCRLYYYRFSLAPGSSNIITHEFALAAIPFEFPTISPFTEMSRARYVYGCSTSDESFGAALGKATKIDILVRVDVQALLSRAQKSPPQAVDGCIDTRTMDEILGSTDRNDPIKAFQFPPNHFGQEARFVPRSVNKSAVGNETEFAEEDGYLLFYVFNEDQLDEDGECKADAESELWVLDARDMQTVVCKIQLGARIPYGLHGNWFTEADIAQQREIATVRPVSDGQPEAGSSKLRKALVSCLG
jgi:carotenoid cleavage dioxygenase-like enzyme